MTKTVIFLVVVLVAAVAATWRWRTLPSRQYGSIDAIVPAYNEEPCIEAAVEGLLRNRYVRRVIVVNDGSTDGTGASLDLLAARHANLRVLHQRNTGKGGALMAGLALVDAPYVFLTDADTLVPADGNGLGFLLAEMERGADAAGGIPASNLKGAGFLPRSEEHTSELQSL